MKFILASGSPRRIKMMKDKGYNPEIIPANVSEELPLSLEMKSAVMYLALKKALWVESQKIIKQKTHNYESNLTDDTAYNELPIIIAADTIVYKDKIIGKPSSPAEAFNTLSSLRNTWHYVATGVCIIKAGTPIRKTFCEVTKVFFKDFSDEELQDYVNTDEPYDKAGGYAIQGTFNKFIDHIEGDYDNVVGFPWKQIEIELMKLKYEL